MRFVTDSRASLDRLSIRGFFGILGLVLGFFVLYPLLMLILRSISGTGAESSSLFRVFTLPETWRACANSLKAAAGVTVLTTITGGSLAWVVVRTDYPHKKTVGLFALTAFIIPPYIIGLAWLQFFGRSGYLESLLTRLFLLETYDFQYYSVSAVVIVMTLHLYPLMFLSIRNALHQQDADLERAALLSGASFSKSFITITTPLITPSVLSTGLLVFSRTLANFTVPALLALPVREEFLTTQIFSSLSSLNIRFAATLSLLLVAISTALFWSQVRTLRTYQGSSALKADERGAITVSLGVKRVFVSAALFLFLGLTTILPLVVMLISSFLKRWGLPVQLQYLTLKNYRELLFTEGKAFRAFRNSVVYGASAAALAGLIGSGTAFLGHAMKTRASRILESLATWPMAFPNIVLAVAAILAWNRPPLRFYGTPWALIVTYMILFIPIIMKQVTGLIANHDPSLVWAARLSGASPLQGFFTITLPAILPGLRSGFLISFLVALREIPISLMLYSSGQETVGVLLFGMQSQEYGLEMTSALSILLIILILAGNFLIHTGTKRMHNGKASDKRYLQALWSYKGN